jgi:hypothetical protein
MMSPSNPATIAISTTDRKSAVAPVPLSSSAVHNQSKESSFHGP